MVIKRQPILFLDVINLNNYMYSSKNIDEQLKQFNEKAEQGQILGELGFSNSFEKLIKNVTHQVLKVYREDNIVYADIKIINEALKQSYKSLVFRTISTGSINEAKEADVIEFLSANAISRAEDAFLTQQQKYDLDNEATIP